MVAPMSPRLRRRTVDYGWRAEAVKHGQKRATEPYGSTAQSTPETNKTGKNTND